MRVSPIKLDRIFTRCINSQARRHWALRGGAISNYLHNLHVSATHSAVRNMTDDRARYAKWSHDDLVDRVMRLESQLRSHTESISAVPSASADTASPSSTRKPKAKKIFDASRYASHHIALKFAYLGRNYNGFEHHVNNTTPLTTIEEELWRALMKARLISPTSRDPRGGRIDETPADKEPWEGPVNWNGCEYSKCGRTDRGVSGFGQVVALRVRSNRPLPRPDISVTGMEASETQKAEGNDHGVVKQPDGPQKTFDPARDEMDYPAILNRILPPDIRVLAWCPSPTDTFSARFSCKERRYKYFFTQPSFLPTPSATGQSAFLDIDRMRKAASYLNGAHDFRNFCKVDPSKQISNFIRRIVHASIDEVSTIDAPSFFNGPTFDHGISSDKTLKVYTFSLHGTAFLWHQVRCIMAVLFLVGQRLEEPEVVLDMFDMSESSKGRPKYEMAHEAPLVLWDCIFPLRSGDDDGKPYETGEHIDDAMPWRYTGDLSGTQAASSNGGNFDAQWGRSGLMDGLWRQWRSRKMDEILAGSLMDRAASKCIPDAANAGPGSRSTLVYDGGDGSRGVGKYVPMMKRDRMEPVDVVNARYVAKKGIDAKGNIANGEVMDVDE